MMKRDPPTREPIQSEAVHREARTISNGFKSDVLSHITNIEAMKIHYVPFNN